MRRALLLAATMALACHGESRKETTQPTAAAKETTSDIQRVSGSGDNSPSGDGYGTGSAATSETQPAEAAAKRGDAGPTPSTRDAGTPLPQ